MPANCRALGRLWQEGGGMVMVTEFWSELRALHMLDPPSLSEEEDCDMVLNEGHAEILREN